jgi:hypothetical protein
VLKDMLDDFSVIGDSGVLRCGLLIRRGVSEQEAPRQEPCGLVKASHPWAWPWSNAFWRRGCSLNFVNIWLQNVSGRIQFNNTQRQSFSS